MPSFAEYCNCRLSHEPKSSPMSDVANVKINQITARNAAQLGVDGDEVEISVIKGWTVGSSRRGLKRCLSEMIDRSHCRSCFSLYPLRSF